MVSPHTGKNSQRLPAKVIVADQLLATWGEKYESLRAYCDESKPIHEVRDFFDTFIGREDKAYLRFGDQESPSFIYNLAGPINVVDSKAAPGVQIADVLASSLAYASRNPDEKIVEEWLGLLEDLTVNQIAPNFDDVDIWKQQTYVNSLVLRELVDRSVKGLSLFVGMDEFILSAKSTYQAHLLE